MRLTIRPVAELVLLVTLAGCTPGCVHPVPNPGAVVVSCTMDAVRDPKIVDAVMDALAKPDFASSLASLINPAIGVTAEVVACILHSYLGKMSADPAHPENYQHARSYLQSRGYEVP